jgi:hypothetical protein
MGIVSRNDREQQRDSSVPTRTEPASGYESPDDEHHFIPEPHRMKSSPAAIPHRRPHASAAFMERGNPPPPHASLNDVVLKAKDMRCLGLRDRIACVQWTWFTMTMVCPPFAAQVLMFTSYWYLHIVNCFHRACGLVIV